MRPGWLPPGFMAGGWGYSAAPRYEGGLPTATVRIASAWEKTSM